VVAVAEGFGLDWTEISETDGLELKLNEDRPLDGRVLDSNRTPLAGVKVLVHQISHAPNTNVATLLDRFVRDSGAFKNCRGPLPGLPVVTTDADGRFRLTGLGRDRIASLTVEGPVPGTAGGTVVNRPAGAVSSPVLRGTPVEFVSSAGRTIRGTVRDRVTSAPLAGIKIGDRANQITTETDKDGRYELVAFPGGQKSVLAQAQGRQPYFDATVKIQEPDARDARTVDFDLVRGIPIHGRVLDEVSHLPPKRATVEYYPLLLNASASTLNHPEAYAPVASAPVEPDGSFKLVALPGPGVVLAVASPRDSYASAWIDDKELTDFFNDGKEHRAGSFINVATGGGLRWSHCLNRYNAALLIKPAAGEKALTCDFKLTPARFLRGLVVGPDGKPLAGASVVGLTAMPATETLERASFVVEGLGPNRPRELCFYHKESGLGKVLTLQGGESKELSVQLAPCGTVSGRVVDRTGKPIAGKDFNFVCDRHGLRVGVRTDRDGRFRAHLVPGLVFRPSVARGPVIQLESGQTRDLGDVLSNN
jgi:hypothetical protein